MIADSEFTICAIFSAALSEHCRRKSCEGVHSFFFDRPWRYRKRGKKTKGVNETPVFGRFDSFRSQPQQRANRAVTSVPIGPLWLSTDRHRVTHLDCAFTIEARARGQAGPFIGLGESKFKINRLDTFHIARFEYDRRLSISPSSKRRCGQRIVIKY
jgi:hypothetical protein